jgi:hypothetical protein
MNAAATGGTLRAPPAELVAFLRTRAGRILALATMAVLLRVNAESLWLEITAAVAVATAYPAHRRRVVGLAGIFWLLERVPTGWSQVALVATARGVTLPGWFRVASLLEAIVCVGLWLWLCGRWSRLLPLRRPILSLIVLYLGACAAAAYAPLPSLVVVWGWGLLFALAPFLWFTAYALLHQRDPRRSPLLVRLGQFSPFWGGTYTPFPKGEANLAKIEARDPEELATWQLKGLRLLLWATVLGVCWNLFDRFFYGTLRVPTTVQALVAVQHGQPGTLATRWLALLGNFVSSLFSLSVLGHLAIGVCRMAGFKALRNTYRPLAATTIADFYNRVYFYFKELLAEVFFYPTYLRFFKARPRLRLFVATVAAAGFGNVVFHYLRDMQYVASLGPWRAAVAFRAYILYGAILGVAVGVSQLGMRRARRTPLSTWGRLLANARVILFYVVVLIFDDPSRDVPLSAYFQYLLGLVVP